VAVGVSDGVLVGVIVMGGTAVKGGVVVGMSGNTTVNGLSEVSHAGTL
jgi:hypothetical protein